MEVDLSQESDVQITTRNSPQHQAGDLKREAGPTTKDIPILDKNRVHALLGRGILANDPEDEHLWVFVLWGDEKLITPEHVEEPNEWDPEANFNDEKVQQLITTLPAFAIERGEPEKVDKKARAWRGKSGAWHETDTAVPWERKSHGH